MMSGQWGSAGRLDNLQLSCQGQRISLVLPDTHAPICSQSIPLLGKYRVLSILLPLIYFSIEVLTVASHRVVMDTHTGSQCKSAFFPIFFFKRGQSADV